MEWKVFVRHPPFLRKLSLKICAALDQPILIEKEIWKEENLFYNFRFFFFVRITSCLFFFFFPIQYSQIILNQSNIILHFLFIIFFFFFQEWSPILYVILHFLSFSLFTSFSTSFSRRPFVLKISNPRFASAIFGSMIAARASCTSPDWSMQLSARISINRQANYEAYLHVIHRMQAWYQHWRSNVSWRSTLGRCSCSYWLRNV